MTSITIRKLPSATKERLRVQAARSGLSLEAHTRRLLQRAAEEDNSTSSDLATLAHQCFGKAGGIELKLPARGGARDPIRFE
jgi:plasmid stability protein